MPIMASSSIPVSHPDHVTSVWLAERLGAPAGSLRGFDAAPIGTGQVGENMRYVLDWDGHDGPDTVVIKFAALDEMSRNTGIATRSYEREVWFYQQVAGTIAAPVPVVHHAEVIAGTAEMVLLMEDLAPGEQGDQLLGCGEADARLAMEAIAGLHGPRWNDPTLADLDWLGRNDADAIELRVGLYQGCLAGFVDRYADRLDDSVLATAETFGGHLDRYYADGDAPLTLTHGDFRLDNCLFRRDGAGRPISVVDWGGIGHGRPGGDVGYFLGAGLQPDLAAGLEDGLVEHYHAALLEHGVTGFGLDECRDEVRRGACSGLAMAVIASQIVRQEERGDEMFCVMAERHAAQMERLDSFGVF